MAILGIVVALLRFFADDDAAPPEPTQSTPPPAAQTADASPNTAAAAVPTADAAGRLRLAEDVVVREAAWTRTDFGEVQTLVLIEHQGTQSFANVAVRVAVLDSTGAEMEVLDYGFSRLEAGEVTPATRFVETPADQIGSLAVSMTTRGTVPARGPIEFDDVAWAQDDIGTVTVTGRVSSSSNYDATTLVAVLRDADGTYAGSAFGVVEAVSPSPRSFELVGFPPSDIVAVELYSQS